MQFNHINRRARAFQRRGDPVVSVDTKKKELVGDFGNGGREWRPQGEPERVRVHDFKDEALGKAVPYGCSPSVGLRSPKATRTGSGCGLPLPEPHSAGHGRHIAKSI